MSEKSISDQVSALVNHEWIVKTAANYFENTQLLTSEDTAAIRANLLSDVLRERFKPSSEGLEKNCAIYLKMVARNIIKGKITSHMSEQRNKELVKNSEEKKARKEL